MDDPNKRPASERLPAEYVRLLLDACWKAKSITELMPEIPKA